jgi:hypothetical protein
VLLLFTAETQKAQREFFALSLRRPAISGMTDRIILINCRPPARQNSSILRIIKKDLFSKLFIQPLTSQKQWLKNVVYYL